MFVFDIREKQINRHNNSVLIKEKCKLKDFYVMKINVTKNTTRKQEYIATTDLKNQFLEQSYSS